MSDESEKIMQQLAQKMADDMMAALCGASAFQKPRPTALRVNSFGAFEVVDLDDDGKIIEPPARCCYGTVLHAPNCKTWGGCDDLNRVNITTTLCPAILPAWHPATKSGIIPHQPEGILYCGSFEVRYADGRKSVFYYWDDVPGRRLRTDAMTQEQAKKAAQDLARKG